MNEYCGVKFSRGSGLGNKLFPWARCVIFSKKNNISMFWPNWLGLKKTVFIKGGIDYRRSIGKILLFNNFADIDHNYVTPFDQLKIRVTRKPNEITWFQGDGNFFDDLHSHHEFLKRELTNITNRNIYSKVNTTKHIPIVLNIRRGKDFSDANQPEDFYQKGAIRTPLTWFKTTLEQIREEIGEDLPAIIISDGKPSDFHDFLEMPNLSLANTFTAIEDLHLMSNAELILGSGGSSFTAWGAFLSKAATLTIPGQSLQWFNVTNDQQKQLVSTYDPINPDLEMLRNIIKSISD